MTTREQSSPTPGDTRRQFLVKTAAAAGAASLLAGAGKSPPARRLRPVVSPMPRRRVGSDETIRMAVIGVGGMGDGHCVAFMNLNQTGRENVQIVALCDVCGPSRLDRTHPACEEKQGIKVDRYGDYKEVLARDDIHGVLIATPEHWHAQMVIDALTAGKDVYCEKPMTLRLADALEVRKFAQASDNLLQIGTQYMMLPKYHEARKLIATGEYGKPTFSQTSYCRNTPSGEWNYYAIDETWEPGVNLDWEAWCGELGPREWDPKIYARWRRYRDFSTGIIGDLLVHMITPLINAMDVGWPIRVVATGGHYIDKDMENHDQVNLEIQFENEHTMIVAGSTCNEVGLETMIRTNKANFYLNGYNCVMRPERVYAEDIDALEVTCENIGNDQDALRLNWLDCIRTRKQVASPVEHATRVMVAVDLATRSMWEGGAYGFDPRTHKVSKL